MSREIVRRMELRLLAASRIGGGCAGSPLRNAAENAPARSLPTQPEPDADPPIPSFRLY
jgi:hypothetical protein